MSHDEFWRVRVTSEGGREQRTYENLGCYLARRIAREARENLRSAGLKSTVKLVHVRVVRTSRAIRERERAVLAALRQGELNPERITALRDALKYQE